MRPLRVPRGIGLAQVDTMQMILTFIISILIGSTWASTAFAAEERYSIPTSEMPDIDYAYEPQLYQTLEKAYLKIFKSAAGQDILASFADCSENYFGLHFELKGATAKQASLLCEGAKKKFSRSRDESHLEDYEREYLEGMRQRTSKRAIDKKRMHLLKLVANVESISSYTYIGNQTIIKLPLQLAYKEDLLAALLLHETAIYFDSKSPFNIVGFLKDHQIEIDHLNFDIEVILKAWSNPFISEALSVLRAYRQEKLFFSELSPESRRLIEHKWYARLNHAQDAKSCGALLKDYISEILMNNEDYLHYRWTSSFEFGFKSKGFRADLSRAEIVKQTQKDLEVFLKTRIDSSQVKSSLCEFALIPEYGSAGIILNEGPRPPIKPGSAEAVGGSGGSQWEQ